jgi:hypothetical protein
MCFGLGVHETQSITGQATKLILDTPSRKYTGKETVGKEYDAWTDDGVLEHYWGEHIHLGYYSEEVPFVPHAQRSTIIRSPSPA